MKFQKALTKIEVVLLVQYEDVHGSIYLDTKLLTHPKCSPLVEIELNDLPKSRKIGIPGSDRSYHESKTDEAFSNLKK